MKKIFIDATGIVNTPTGLGKYSYYLLSELVKNTDYKFTILHQSKLEKSHPLLDFKRSNIAFMSMDIPTIGPKREMKMLSLRKAINEHNIFHCLSSYLPAFGLHIASIVTVHDLKYLLFPAFFDDQLKLLYYSWIIRRSMYKATHIVAVSFSTRNDIIKEGIASSKISVIYEAPTINTNINDKLLPAQLKGKNFILYVGENRPHKNIARIIDAYEIVLKRIKDECPYFVFVGQKFDDFRKKFPGSQLLFLGAVPETILASLYKKALVLVYPSLYEGFGLPIVEAMAFGTPVITSNCSSMQEVADKAAILIDPNNTDHLVAAILKIVQDKTEREKFSDLSIHRAKCFSWNRSATQVAILYKNILNNKNY